MPALAHQFARLVGSFHGTFSAARKTRVFRSLMVRHNFRTQFWLRARDWRGLYGTPPGSSMRTSRLLAPLGKDFDPIDAPDSAGRRSSA